MSDFICLYDDSFDVIMVDYHASNTESTESNEKSYLCDFSQYSKSNNLLSFDCTDKSILDLCKKVESISVN